MSAFTLSATAPSACGAVTASGSTLNTLKYEVKFGAPSGADAAGATAGVTQTTSGSIVCVKPDNTTATATISRAGSDGQASGTWTTTWGSDLSALAPGSACEMIVTVRFADSTNPTTFVTASLPVAFRIE